jgi:hypothetical protein
VARLCDEKKTVSEAGMKKTADRFLISALNNDLKVIEKRTNANHLKSYKSEDKRDYNVLSQINVPKNSDIFGWNYSNQTIPYFINTITGND